MKTVVFVTS